MAWVVSKAPNGLYFVFSTVMDGFIKSNLTKEELTQFYKDEYIKKAIQHVDMTVVEIESNLERNFELLHDNVVTQFKTDGKSMLKDKEHIETIFREMGLELNWPEDDEDD